MNIYKVYLFDWYIAPYSRIFHVGQYNGGEYYGGLKESRAA